MPFVIVRPIELQRLDGLGAAIRIKPTTGQQRASSDSGDAIFDAPSRTYKMLEVPACRKRDREAALGPRSK
jgi:hypothetical protein